MKPTFVPSDRFDATAMAELFTRGYQGYYTEIRLDAAGFEGMAEAQNIDRAASRVALLDGKPVGFAMLGVRGDTGWIGGMGVAPEGRGRGLGEQLMRATIEQARKLRLVEVHLEVLVENTQAIPIYERLGFRDTRRLDVLLRSPAPLVPPVSPLKGIEAVAPLEVFTNWDALHAERSPWQRDRRALEHWAVQLQGLGVRESGRLVAAVLFKVDAARSSLLDLAMDGAAREPLIARCAAAAVARGPQAPWLLLNLPEAHPSRPALLALGFGVKHTQREMALVL